MHPTAMDNGKRFFDTYLPAGPVTVVDLGSQDVNGSLKEVCPSTARYIGVDFVAGKGVDKILEDPYSLPFDDASVDFVVSSSVFEHSEMFWILYLEILRILKPAGLFYLNCPSNGEFHRWPVDCWRFYPDSGRGLITWAKRNGINAGLLESYTSNEDRDQWRDFVSVFVKDVHHASNYKKRILHTFSDFTNGLVDDDFATFRNFNTRPDLLNKEAPKQKWRLFGKSDSK